MINRRKALLGYATWLVATRVAKRELRKRARRLRPQGLHDGQGGHMLKRNKATTAVADRATSIVETVKPVVNRALNDPELHEAIKKAFVTGREVQEEVRGKPPKKAAKKLARDRKLQRKVEHTAQDLQKAIGHLVEKPKPKHRFAKVVGGIAALGAAAGGAVFAIRKLRGRDDEQPY